jgi:hypothetical protein
MSVSVVTDPFFGQTKHNMDFNQMTIGNTGNNAANRQYQQFQQQYEMEQRYQMQQQQLQQQQHKATKHQQVSKSMASRIPTTIHVPATQAAPQQRLRRRCDGPVRGQNIFAPSDGSLMLTRPQFGQSPASRATQNSGSVDSTAKVPAAHGQALSRKLKRPTTRFAVSTTRMLPELADID